MALNPQVDNSGVPILDGKKNESIINVNKNIEFEIKIDG